MSMLRPVRDPLDAARQALEHADEHLDRIRQRVESGDLDGNALTMAQLRHHHAQERFTALVRGEHPGPGDAA